jgi:hypothetical protein
MNLSHQGMPYGSFVAPHQILRLFPSLKFLVFVLVLHRLFEG